MQTVAYLFILTGLIIVSEITRGRGVADIPKDLGDLMVAAITMDNATASDVMKRKGEGTQAAVVNATLGNSPTQTPSGPGHGTASGFPVNNGKTDSVVALGHVLKAKGFLVGEGPPPFGPINRVHTANSYHYRQLALDVNWPNAKQEMAKIDAIIPALRAAKWRIIWRTKGHFDHLHVDAGPAGMVSL